MNEKQIHGEHILPKHINTAEQVHSWIMSLSQNDTILDEIITNPNALNGEIIVPNNLNDDELHQWLMTQPLE